MGRDFGSSQICIVFFLLHTTHFPVQDGGSHKDVFTIAYTSLRLKDRSAAMKLTSSLPLLAVVASTLAQSTLSTYTSPSITGVTTVSGGSSSSEPATSSAGIANQISSDASSTATGVDTSSASSNSAVSSSASTSGSSTMSSSASASSTSPSPGAAGNAKQTGVSVAQGATGDGVVLVPELGYAVLGAVGLGAAFVM